MSASLKSLRKHSKLLLDFLLVAFFTALLIRPLFQAKYSDRWPSIESTFISDGRFLAAHWPHPLWQPLWYCGTRFDYVYPPVLRYGTALLASFFIPVKAYHVFIALVFCLGIAGVYLFVRVMGRSRTQAWLSAAGCALLSPSFLFIKIIRDDAPHLLPIRLGVLIRYGEGPHISSLALLPFALAFAWLGLQRRRNGALALAAIFSALVTLTNFYGATALAIFYPILVWTMWVTTRERNVWLRAVAIPALAYALAAFWLTPAYLRITIYNLRYVSEPGNQYSVYLALAAVLLFGAGSLRWASRKPALAFPVFVGGSLLFMSLNVLGHFYFNFRILGEPHRLIPELDLTIILAVLEVLRRFLNNRMPLARPAVAVVALGSFWQIAHFVPHAWEMYPKEPDYRKRVEYRVSDWVATHLPDARVYAAGSNRFWLDAWHDVAQVGGGSDQGIENPNPLAASWEIFLGPDPEISVRWLQSLGADAIIMSDAHSQEVYHDYKLPYKFAGVLPVLFDDHEGNVIYRVPRRYSGLARVVDTAQSRAAKPVVPATNIELLRAYSNMVEAGPEVPATTRWSGTDSITVHANVKAGQSVLVQVTYDPAWRAYAGGLELPVRQDAMDFMAIDAPAGTQDIVLVFETPLGNKIGYVVTGFAVLLCLVMGFVGMRKAPDADDVPETTDAPADSGFPPYFRLARGLLRWLNRRARTWTPALPPDPFDPERLQTAETALRALRMPDAGGEAYLDKHIPRLARTLALVPAPQTTGRVLELGCYMQITPLLQRVCGYKEVRGAYYGPTGKIDRKTYDFPEGQFSCYVDHFDVERDPFPYPAGYFDLVVAGEIIEHMTHDPMRMLLETRRVLADGGYILITTPNVGSVTSAAKTLEGRDNPQIFFLYERPVAGTPTEIGHVREYTVHELGEAVRAAGFEIELLATTFIEEWSEHRALLAFLALNDYSIDNRGEQIWCLARKRAGLPIDRYPWFIYTP